MSSKNKEIVEKVNAAFARGESDEFLAYCTNDFEWNMIGEKVTKGKEAVRQWMSSMKDMEPPKFTVDEIIADGDAVACYGDMTMKNKEGNPESYSYCDVYHFKNDAIARLQSFLVKHRSEPESGKKATA